jgi:hypothetical protein
LTGFGNQRATESAFFFLAPLLDGRGVEKRVRLGGMAAAPALRRAARGDLSHKGEVLIWRWYHAFLA